MQVLLDDFCRLSSSQLTIFSSTDGAKCADGVTKDSLAEFNVGKDLGSSLVAFLPSV